jgi:uncharacterized DUF497 family protein
MFEWDDVLFIVYTWRIAGRGQVHRIISARLAKRREREVYDKIFK